MNPSFFSAFILVVLLGYAAADKAGRRVLKSKKGTGKGKGKGKGYTPKPTPRPTPNPTRNPTALPTNRPSPDQSPNYTSQSVKISCEACQKFGCFTSVLELSIERQERCNLHCSSRIECPGYGALDFKGKNEDDKTMEPTPTPTPSPTTDEPTKAPTFSPTPKVTSMPTPEPTVDQTQRPTRPPKTARPSETPTLIPTISPTTPPTPFPTERPSVAPTPKPTRPPKTARPTEIPTTTPTPLPTRRPTPTPRPTRLPKTAKPTNMPSSSPKKTPTTPPTPRPTKRPTAPPTNPPLTPEPSPSFEGKLDKCLICKGCTADECKRLGCDSLLPSCFEADTSPPTTAPSLRKPGMVCSGDEECESNTCRNGACMASSECYPVKHNFGTPFDRNHVNIVFVASAFNTTTKKAWRRQVQKTYKVFKGYNMFSSKLEQLSVFRVDPAELNPSFCGFNCAGVDRLLCCSVTTAQELSAKCFENGNNLQTVVIHNDDKYGGAGYTELNIATVSTNARGPEIAIHELGHSLFELVDEYDYGQGTDEGANCAATNKCSKWEDLIGNTPKGYNNVSCVPGCNLDNFYVGELSYMESLSNPVGAVNERYTCCTYQALTKSMPPYCDVFNSQPNYVMNFCKTKDYQNYGSLTYDEKPAEFIPESMVTDKAKYVQISDPLLVQVRLSDSKKGGAHLLGKPSIGPSGVYRKRRVLGDYVSLRDAARKGVKTVLRIKVFYASKMEELFFSINTTVDVPAQPDRGLTTQDPLRVSTKAGVVNLALNTRGRTVTKLKARLVGA